ncbi:PEP/pyruvate-binding domain-containing protein [uncultured Friedmanniella sp.]|uniref:PEP/pyruvate-binding domain-containing protein n=1 Tax=uncultured Friedmanniella sp. TaxID=335381 RepID=UPI0035CB38EA
MVEVRGLAEFGRDDVALVGGKAANLGELVRAGFDVPPGFVVTTGAYRDFLATHDLGTRLEELAAGGPERSGEIRGLFETGELPAALRTQVSDAYAALDSPAVAVRSSATAEDLAEASFAGQQDTYLDVEAVDAVLAAVRSCWASLWTDRAMTYRAEHEVASAGLGLAVVVQQMVPAEVAGVMFTANPLNGRTEETVLSAARGLGEAVVSGAVPTEEVVVDLAAHRLVRSETAAEPVLSDETAYGLAELGHRIEAHFGGPQDVEWALVGTRVRVLQARPVTALAPPEDPPPEDWSVPDPTSLYVRASIVEQLPDPLSPLFADLAADAVTDSLTAMMSELVGEDAVRAGDVSFPTVNGYAYYRYSRTGMLRITLRTYKALPVLGGGRRSGRERWQSYSHPRYRQAVAAWSGRPLADLTATELMAGVVALLYAGAEYYTSVQTLIPVAASSEVLFTRAYDALVRRSGDPAAATFLLGFDSLPIRAEKSLYDLAGWIREEPDLAAAVLGATNAELLADRTSAAPRWPGLWSRLRGHLDAYGHLVYNLDFVNPVPADDPGPLLDTLRFYLGDRPADPYRRQLRSSVLREAATTTLLSRLGAARRMVVLPLLRWAQASAPMREDALADVGLAWPQLRRLLTELGGRLVAAGAVTRVEDVYWLTSGELTAALDQDRPASLEAEVAHRQRRWRGQRRVTPPQVLPEAGWLRLMERWLPAASTAQEGDVLSGLAGSAGRVTAVARVLERPEDFGSFRPGEVLVAPITTPAWTSLFVRAAAVVTDVGGPLSHSSIVAREYGIPAVLGTGIATRRIRTGQRVTVDGDAGTVTLLAENSAGHLVGDEGLGQHPDQPRAVATTGLVMPAPPSRGPTPWRSRSAPPRSRSR